MQRHRKANAFPDIGTPGDPRLLAAIERRTPGIAGGGINHVFGKTVITPPKKSKRAAASTAYIPWKPAFFTEGTTESPVYKCRFNLGTVNNVTASNWNDPFTLSMGDDAFYFVIITITSASGIISGLTISIESTAPATDDVSKGTPPTSHKIVLGAIGITTAKMIEDANLNATASVVFNESKSAPAEGAEPFDRWWRWNHTKV